MGTASSEKALIPYLLCRTEVFLYWCNFLFLGFKPKAQLTVCPHDLQNKFLENIGQLGKHSYYLNLKNSGNSFKCQNVLFLKPLQIYFI